jgi:hypothetical protein
LVDTAEMKGLYVKTQKHIDDAQVQPLASPVFAAADAASVVAQATAAAAAAALAAAVGEGSEGAAAADQGSSSVGLAEAVEVVLDAVRAQPALQLPTQQQQQEQVFEPLQQPRQATRLDGYSLQRPHPPQRQQQHGQSEQQQPSARQQQQQLEQQGLDHPLLRSQLLPPPALPKVQQQWHGALPAAAVGSLPVGHSNGTSHGRIVQGKENSSLQDSSSQQQLVQQQLADNTLVHPVEQL